MQTTKKRLVLHKETLRTLRPAHLTNVVGGDPDAATITPVIETVVILAKVSIQVCHLDGSLDQYYCFTATTSAGAA